MPAEEGLSHVAEDVETQNLPGEDTSHADEVTTPTEPGVEEADKPPEGEKPSEKVYSIEDWGKFEADLLSRKDTEIGELRQIISKASMQETLMQAQAVEQQARVADAKAVDDGTLTEVQVLERQNQRQSIARQQQELTRQAQQLQIAHQQNEPLYREIAAYKIAKETGIEPDVLLSDASLDTPQKMMGKAGALKDETKDTKIKALERKVATLEGTAPPSDQHFDRGQAGTVISGAWSKIQDAYAKREITTEEYTAQAKKHGITP